MFYFRSTAGSLPQEVLLPVILYTYREGKAAFRRDTPRPFDTAALSTATIKLWKAGANDIIQTRIYESLPKVHSLVGPEAA